MTRTYQNGDTIKKLTYTSLFRNKQRTKKETTYYAEITNILI